MADSGITSKYDALLTNMQNERSQLAIEPIYSNTHHPLDIMHTTSKLDKSSRYDSMNSTNTTTDFLNTTQPVRKFSVQSRRATRSFSRSTFTLTPQPESPSSKDIPLLIVEAAAPPTYLSMSLQAIQEKAVEYQLDGRLAAVIKTAHDYGLDDTAMSIAETASVYTASVWEYFGGKQTTDLKNAGSGGDGSVKLFDYKGFKLSAPVSPLKESMRVPKRVNGKGRMGDDTVSVDAGMVMKEAETKADAGRSLTRLFVPPSPKPGKTSSQ